MTSIEPIQSKSPREYIEESFHTHPDQPVGEMDISDLVEQAALLEASEPGYAWQRMPTFVAAAQGIEQHITVRRRLHLDLFSSLPIYSEGQRTRGFQRSGERGNDLAKELLSGKVATQLAEAKLTPIASALANNVPARRLLGAAIQEVIYALTVPEAERDGKYPSSALHKRLHERLTEQSVIYEGHSSAITGISFEAVQQDMTYAQALGSLTVPTAAAYEARQRLRADYTNKRDRVLAKETDVAGQDMAAALIDLQALYLAELISGNRHFRPARYFSMDIAAPQAIALSSIRNTPQSTQERSVFSRAIKSLFNPHKHITANLFDSLPVDDGSVSFISGFDGYPFDFRHDPERHGPLGDDEFGPVALGLLQHFYSKLAPGGKIVLFPWGANIDDEVARATATTTLDNVLVDLGDSVRHGIGTETFSRGTLEGWMSPADAENAQTNSSIFRPPISQYVALVVAKPRAASLRNLQAASRVNVQR